ncbi:hypothetical protein D918_03011 [Trichuris suis]|nr:hypothetical protein D918_03011 [Trichuris suis]
MRRQNQQAFNTQIVYYKLYRLKPTLSYKNSLTNEDSISSFGATMVPLYLLTLALLVQSTIQESLEWTLDDQEALQRRAFIFFYQVLAPIKILDIVTTSFDKCSHKHRKPYGTGKFTLKVSCPNEDPVSRLN